MDDVPATIGILHLDRLVSRQLGAFDEQDVGGDGLIVFRVTIALRQAAKVVHLGRCCGRGGTSLDVLKDLVRKSLTLVNDLLLGLRLSLCLGLCGGLCGFIRRSIHGLSRIGRIRFLADCFRRLCSRGLVGGVLADSDIIDREALDFLIGDGDLSVVLHLVVDQDSDCVSRQPLRDLLVSGIGVIPEIRVGLCGITKVLDRRCDRVFLYVTELDTKLLRVIVEDVGLPQLSHNGLLVVIAKGLAALSTRCSPHVGVTIVLIQLVHVGVERLLHPLLIAQHEVGFLHGDRLGAIGGGCRAGIKCSIRSTQPLTESKPRRVPRPYLF